MNRGSAASRRLALRRLLADHEVGNQQELRRLLAGRGYRVDQTTVSRDLAALGAVKTPDERGGRYTVPPASARSGATVPSIARILKQFVLDIDSSQNLVVLKTPPGAAGSVAAALDQGRPDGVLGTLAGDDTVLVVAKSPRGGSALAGQLTRLLENRS